MGFSGVLENIFFQYQFILKIFKIFERYITYWEPCNFSGSAPVAQFIETFSTFSMAYVNMYCIDPSP